ncbi:MAG: thiamine phosphate synthase [Lachnospiraceae bacterium]
MKNKAEYTLYLCTDRELMSTPTIEESVEQAIQGGCTIVQLREKECTSLEFYQLALRVREITEGYHVPLLINDRVDIALAADAQGVHIGQSDLPAAVVRKLIGPEKILGVSAATEAEAVQAVQQGADYLGIGAMYATATKTDAQLVSRQELEKIRNAVAVPLVAIGGMNKHTVPLLRNTGIDGIAVVSAIVAQEHIAEAAAELLRIFRGESE